jgi:hypothetical protein
MVKVDLKQAVNYITFYRQQVKKQFQNNEILLYSTLLTMLNIQTYTQSFQLTGKELHF